MNELGALSLARRIIGQEVETLRELAEGLTGIFWECASRIADCPGLVWTTGVGTSAAVSTAAADVPCFSIPATACTAIQVCLARGTSSSPCPVAGRASR